MFFSSLSGVNPVECVSMNNQIVNINSNEPLFYLLSIQTTKCSGSCNKINDPYAKLCVTGVAKNLNIKIFNLMSRTNETRHIKWHETCKSKFRLDPSVFNNKQRWNEDKCWCECKELFDKGVCDKEFIWNDSNCELECDKSCDIGEYLDYSNHKCRKKLVDKLVEECTGNIDKIEIASENEDKNEPSSCTLYIVLCSMVFTINVGIGIYFVYYKYMSRIEKKMFLNMIMSIKQHFSKCNSIELIKWNKSKN